MLWGTFVTSQVSEPQPRAPGLVPEEKPCVRAPGPSQEGSRSSCRKQCLAPHSSCTREAQLPLPSFVRKMERPPPHPKPRPVLKAPEGHSRDQFLPIFPCIGKKSNKGKSSQLNGCPQRSSSPFCLCRSAQQLCVCWRGKGPGQRPGITLLPVNFLAGHLLKSLTSVLHLPHL